MNHLSNKKEIVLCHDTNKKEVLMSMKSVLAQFMLERNKNQSELFCSPDSSLARRLYRQQHPTEIMVLKCMDGRLNGSVITETPLGILQPVRNIGGFFDLGWPFLGELIGDWVRYSINNGRRSLLIVTYHWSKGDKHRGCRGFNYDLDAARNESLRLRRQIERVFGQEHQVVFPIMVGIETDEDTLLLHGNDPAATLNLADETVTNDQYLLQRIHKLYPDMHTQVANDLLPLVSGNLRHAAGLRAKPREVEDMNHREQILAIGRGFDWLHLVNRALIIGPYSFDLATPIETAASILLSNLREGVIPKDDGVLLFTSGAYRDDTGFAPPLAVEKALSITNFAYDVISRRVPDLLPHLHVLAGTVNLNTRLFDPVPYGKE